MHAHVLSDFAKERAALGRGPVRHHRRQCRAAGERAGRELPEQGASRHAGEGLRRDETTRMQPDERFEWRRRKSQRERRMGFKCGILGLSNVGKSTLFNALTETAAAQAANYPFCTIEPNVGEVVVPDPRLDVLAKLAKSAKIVPTRLTFVDIAGLVRGASQGRGPGQSVPCPYPRGRRHRACGALLRGQRSRPRAEPHRPDRRHRDHRDRADAGRSRQPGAARRRARRRKRKEATRMQRGQGDARSRAAARSCCCATASRRASSSASPRRRRPFTCSGC